jgi:hypothetical protein
VGSLVHISLEQEASYFATPNTDDRHGARHGLIAGLKANLRQELRLHRLENRGAILVDLFYANAGDGLKLGQRARVLNDDGTQG